MLVSKADNAYDEHDMRTYLVSCRRDVGADGQGALSETSTTPAAASAAATAKQSALLRIVRVILLCDGIASANLLVPELQSCDFP
jgi:hypothetical protein